MGNHWDAASVWQGRDVGRRDGRRETPPTGAHAQGGCVHSQCCARDRLAGAQEFTNDPVEEGWQESLELIHMEDGTHPNALLRRAWEGLSGSLESAMDHWFESHLLGKLLKALSSLVSQKVDIEEIHSSQPCKNCCD